jgi:hypothetical protein
VRFDARPSSGVLWQGTTEVNGARVLVQVPEGPDAEERAAATVTAVVTAGLALRQHCGEQLADTRNEGWSRDGEHVEVKDFVLRLAFRAIRSDPDGTTIVTFDDGGLFWGHRILVHLDPTGAPVDVEVSD